MKFEFKTNAFPDFNQEVSLSFKKNCPMTSGAVLLTNLNKTN